MFSVTYVLKHASIFIKISVHRVKLRNSMNNTGISRTNKHSIGKKIENERFINYSYYSNYRLEKWKQQPSS